MRLADFTAPETPAAHAALDLARVYSSPALLDHVLRSWLWSEAFAVVEGLTDVDHELLYVAALLHDIGSAPEFDNVALSYEEAGGHVAVALTAGAGWSAPRRQRVLDVIVRHNWPSVDPGMDVEGHLLEKATGFDISGAHPGVLPAGFVDEVLDAHPRGTLVDEFATMVVDQSERKPSTAARRLVTGGIVDKLRSNPLDR